MGTQSRKNDATIRELVERWAAAMRAKDTDTVVSFFDADNVMFVLDPPLQHKSADSPGAEGLQKWFESWDGPLGYEVTDLHVTTGEDVAFCHSLNHMTGKKVDGERVDLWFRETLCFKKTDGAWKIVHEHESVPFYMDGSRRAALDLRP